MLVPLVALLLFQAADPAAQGIKALDERRYADAAAVFERIVASDPKDYSAHFNLGFAYSMLNKDPEAITEYKKVLELKPGVFEAELNLGHVLLRDRLAAEALPHLEAAVKAKPNQFRPNFYAGAAALETGDLDKAQQCYEAAAKLDPKAAGPELGLAHVAERKKDLNTAEIHFRKAAELDPKYKDSLLELASLLEANKQPEKAIELYKLFPDDPGARERMGQLMLEQGDAGKAIDELRAAVDKSPTSANRYALAIAYIRNKELEKAEPLLVELVNTEPANTDVRMRLARLLRDERKFANAAQQFALVLRQKPGAADAWSEYAGVLYLLGRDSDTINALDRLRSLGAEKPGHIFLRAITYDRNRNLEPALEAYERFLAVSNGNDADDEFKARQRLRIIRRELHR